MTTDLGMPAVAPRGVGHLRGTRSFPAAARDALADTQLRRNLGHATQVIRTKRAHVVGELDDWEELRLAGEAMKRSTLARLDEHLERLEREVTARGGVVHWARDALQNTQLRRNLGHATQVIRTKRAHVVGELDDWDQLRLAGEAMKRSTMARLDEHLERLEREVTARGGVVHWARDANEANEIVARLVQETGETEVVKVKSMATQEIGLNEALEAAGI